MRRTSSWPRSFTRLLAAFGASFLLLLFAAWLSAQNPDKKPKDEEKEEKTPHRIKKMLRVEDDEPKAKTESSTSFGMAELKVEALETKDPAVRDLYQKLAVPYDLVHKSPEGTMRITPYYRHVEAGASFKGDVIVRRIDEAGKFGPTSTFPRKEIKRIEPYEEIAISEVQTYLKAHGSVKELSRRQAVLHSAERALTAVARFHESARSSGVREGQEWTGVGQQVRDQLLKVQSDLVEALAEANDWEQAYALASRLAEANPTPKVQADLAGKLARFVTQSLNAEKYNEVQIRLRLLQDLFPDAAKDAKINATLVARASELFKKAQDTQDPAKKDALLATAETIWPRLPGLRDYRLTQNKAYRILRVGVHAPPENLSPAFAGTDAERWALDLLFESLVKAVNDPSAGVRYQPVLAGSRPRLIPLGREFTLARDAYWSDGTPVTGADVRQTIDALHKQGEAPLLEKAEITRDSQHAQVFMRQGYFDPLALMTFKVLPWNHLDDPDFAKHPVGSGPFVYDRSEKDAVIFKANHNYRRAGKTGQPYIQEIRFVRSKDPAADFGRKMLDVLLDQDAVPRMQSVKEAKIHALTNRRIYFLAVNHRRPVLQNEELRRALALAIHRNQILDEVFRGDLKAAGAVPHRPLNGPYPPGCWACNPEKKDDLYNPARAKVWGMKYKGTRLTLKYPNDDSRVTKACELIRTQVAAIGVELELMPRSPAELRKDVEQDHDYELAYYHFDYPNEAYMLAPLFDPRNTGKGGRNYLGYADGDLQSWFQKTLDHREFAQIQKFTHTIHALLHEKMPLIPLWQLDTLIALHESVKTVPEPARLDPLQLFVDIERWQVK